MIIDIKVPVLPESVSDATLLAWNVKVGDTVTEGQNLIDIETDKVVLELPAPNRGVITEILRQEGDVVESEQVIAHLDTEGKSTNLSKDREDKLEKIPQNETSAIPTPAPEEKNQSKHRTTSSNTSHQAFQTQQGANIAMPSAAKIAAEKNIDVNSIKGSGKDGRVLKEDVQNAALKATEAATPFQSSLSSGNRVEQRVPMTRLRQRVAERLVQSNTENAILTTFNEINMKPVMDLRARYKERFQKEYGIKLGFMSFFVKAAVGALKKYPVVNASIDGNDIVYHGYFDIGIAVSTPRGLVVPILRNAENLSFAQIENQIADFANRAQEGKLSLDEITGGTFSITNGGTFGSMMSTPIINPPQSAILGMHSIYERAIVENGQVVSRPMMYVALSYDHRLIDGKEAVLTLVAIKQFLEDPARLALDI